MSAAERQEKERIERKEIMIGTAKRLFEEYGFEATTMNLISKEAEYTCRTIYHYFTNKEDLFFATIYADYKSLFELMKIQTVKEVTGFEKIKRVILLYQEFSAQNKSFIPNTIKANELTNNIPSEEATPYHKAYRKLYKEIFQFIAVLFHEAQKDASIRADLDANELAISTILTVTGFFHMQSLTSERFNSRFGLSEKEIIDFTVSRLLEGLKGN